jgi:hypothetical protein
VGMVSVFLNPHFGQVISDCKEEFETVSIFFFTQHESFSNEIVSEIFSFELPHPNSNIANSK